MIPATHAADPAEIAAPSAESAGHGAGLGQTHTQGHIHAPEAGATATLIHDLRELFKVKVVALVLVTGWGGFYLGSMQSGISSLQRGLLDTLLGIGLVSAGAGALNEALERKTDARMKRTADRPLASGRFSLAAGNSSPAWALWPSARCGWRCTPTCSPWRWRCSPRSPTSPSTRRSSASPPWPPSSARFPAPWAPCWAGPPPAAASSGPAWPSSPSSSSGSFRTSWPSPGSIATTTRAPAFACCPSSSPTAGPPWLKRSSTPCS